MEDIKRICELTGSRYDEAERAYRDANGDFYLAVGNLQRSRKNGEGMGNNYNDMRGNRNMGMDRNAVQSGFTKFMESRLVFGKTRNCTLPLIFAAAIVLFGFEFAVPAAIIAFILGVRFTLTGPLFNKDIVIGLDRQPAGTAGYGNASYGSSNSYGGAYDGMVYGEDQAPSGGSFRQQYQQQE
ncbi:MAG: hypothetical protein IKR73_02300, partial [Oscillospiraceae bacterium]|nr:hypothetical protein [Oscillospiraceae bacterium]